MGNAVRHLRNMAITKLKPTQVRGSRRVPSHSAYILLNTIQTTRRLVSRGAAV